MVKSRRFTTLEGMRGVAAICIVLMHGQELFGLAAPQSAYLAVDFFFVLSGFILAQAYAKRLDAGLPGLIFMRTRILRLYPLYIVGSLTSVALALFSLFVRGNDALWAFTQPLVSVPFALLMLPSPASSLMYPLNAPAWSLLLELLVNVAFAVRWLRSGPALMVMVGVSAVLLLLAAERSGGLDLGWGKENVAGGLARVFFSFPLGVLLHRVRRRIRLSDALSAAPVLALGVLLYAAPTGTARTVFDLVMVLVLSPLLVLAGAVSHPISDRMNGLYLFLGAISYPIYALYHPILIASVGTIARHVPAGMASIVAGLVIIGTLLAVSWYAARLDTRIGAAIHRHLHRSREVEGTS